MNKFIFLVLIFTTRIVAEDVVVLPNGRVGNTNFFVEGEALYWKAYEDGLYYVQSGRGAGSTALPPAGDDFIGDFKKVKPDHKLGYRVAVGYGFDHDKEDLRVSFLNYRTSGSDETRGHSLVIWAHSRSSNNDRAKYASCSWHCLVRSLEGDFGKSFFWSDHLVLKPALGVMAAKIDQHLDINYTYDVSTSRLAVWEPKSNMKGIGAKGSLFSKFYFCKNFSIYALGSYALLYSKMDAAFRVSEEGHNTAHGYDKFNSGVTALQAALGLEFDLYFASDKCHLGVKCGVEDNFWIGVNQMNHYLYRLGEGMMYQENGNLNLSGLTFNVSVDF